MGYRITIVQTRRPRTPDINEKLQWFGNSVGLFSLRDRDKSCFRIFIQLLKASRINRGLTSDELALSLGLTRGTVIHHINKLKDSGIVVVEGGKYFLRVNNLEVLIDEIEKDIARTMSDLRNVAQEIDKNLGL